MRKHLGFTLIELLVVVSILGILVGLIVNNLSDSRARARDSQRKSNLIQLKTALSLYYNDYQQYPAAKADNTDIKGCGTDAAPANCGKTGEPFSKNSTVYMKQLPEFTYYYQTDSGNSFTTIVTLENTSDPDLATSQARCLDPGSYAATDFVVCSD